MPNWNPTADLDGDGNIGFSDFFIFADNFGRSYVISTEGTSLAKAQAVDMQAMVALEATGGSPTEDRLVRLRVRAQDLAQVDGFGLVLRYDHRAVEFLSAAREPGHLLEIQGGSAPLFRVLAERPGHIVLGNALTDGPPISGDGLLAELEFRLKDDANTAYFDLSDVLVRRGDGTIARIAQVRATRLLPGTFYLGVNFPNPFNPSTAIEYALPQAGPLHLRVYDVLGRKVRDLVRDEAHQPGYYRTIWDGRDGARRVVSSGVYFYRLEARGFTRTQKMTLIK